MGWYAWGVTVVGVGVSSGFEVLGAPANGVDAPLPPYIAPITPDDPDGDGDFDLPTIVDTFA